MKLAAGPHILTRPVAGGGPLLRDYAAGEDLSRFYVGHPGDIDAYVRKAAEVAARLDAPGRARVADAIQPLGDAAERLDRILAGDGFFVTTGQQPALFGGPLYTPYKILAAIQLAEVLERRLERPVLALFWIGSDDHDWEEANHASFLDGDGYARRLVVTAEENVPPLPLSERTWGPGVEKAVDALIELLPDTVHGDAIARHVRAAYTPSSTVAGSFAETIRHLLGDQRFAIVDSAHPAVRRAAAPVLRREAEHAAEHIAATAEQTERLTEAGYSATVSIAANASNLMLQDEYGRDRLMLARGGWTARRSGRPISEADLLRRIEEEPDRFSPNVLLRPVVESALFPTIAYVAGPGEASYFAQIGCLFAAHGILPPVVVPRPGVTIVEAKVAALLERVGLTADEVQEPFDALASRVVSATLPPAVESSLASLRAALHEEYARLIDAAVGVDPTLHGPLLSARNAALITANRAGKKILAHAKRREDVLLEQVRRAAANLYPESRPQERVLNMLYYTARYGPELIDAIRTSLDMELRPIATWHGPLCGESRSVYLGEE